MTLTATLLAVLALVDGACSGFRSSLGRTGLILHRRADREAAVRGLIVVTALLLPAAGFTLVVLGAGGISDTRFREAGDAMLVVLGPYSALVAIALLAYAVLGWRYKYVAMAVVLGPFTLVRPFVALVAGVAGCLACHSWPPAVTIGLALIAVLAVEPLMNLAWRSTAHPGSSRDRS